MRFPQRPPPYLDTALRLIKERYPVVGAARPTLPDGKYLHWDELRHREPPQELTSEEWWASIRWARSKAAVPVREMADLYPLPFSFVALPEIQRALHTFDRTNVGKELLSALGNKDAVTEYRVRQLIEEAISSSEIEGARPTTRELARQMVREQRAPASHDERMIHNNWRAMRRILELRDENRRLTVDDLLELHRILGEGALDIPGSEGQLRQPDHTVVVTDHEGNVWHTPPPAEGLRGRLEAILRFADGAGSQSDSAFIHPVVRAIIVHFWLGYEHPFRDGNGRIARAMYYFCMLRHQYEMAEFLSISGPIDRSPKAYYMAFANTETDEGDLTYFILHQLGVMQIALDELLGHLKERAERMRLLSQTVAGFDELNHRQRALLQHAIRHPLESYTIEGHAASHHVHYQTARADLIDLVTRGYFDQHRTGKGKRFQPTTNFATAVRDDGRADGAAT
jgi:Fic family protein